MNTLAIDASRANRKQRTGVEEYAFQIIQGMKNCLGTVPAGGLSPNVILYTDEPLRGELAKLPENWEERVLGNPLRYGWTLGRMSYECWKRPADALFVPAHVLPFFAPASAITLHDVAWRVSPEAYSRKSRLYLEWAAKRAVKEARAIFTVSEFSKSEIVNRFQVAPEKISVTYPAPSSIFRPEISSIDGEVLKKYGIEKPYLLNIGRMERKKNQGVLGPLAKKFNEETGGKLVLVGRPGVGFEGERSQFEDQSVKFLSGVSQVELAVLYRHAIAFLFPSIYEGFGIPIVEAFASGVPVIASDISAFHEVGGDALRFCPMDDSSAWEKTVLQTVNNTSEIDKMIKKGFENVKKYNWETSARHIIDRISTMK